jgi:hypothetical protein
MAENNEQPNEYSLEEYRKRRAMIRTNIGVIAIGSDAYALELARALANHNNGELLKTMIKQFESDGK